jgi:tetratricopeptide (TPR) repeat protein
MDELGAAAQRLITLAAPYLARGDKDGLARRLESSWSQECLSLLLDHAEPAIVEVAAACLGLVGDMSACPKLAALLHHPSAGVVAEAEDALWAVWFRDGGKVGRAVLARIAGSIRSQETENVVPLLTEIIRSHPSWAEAHHQRGQAHYLENAYSEALRDARRAFELNRFHFAALSIQAHACAALGRYQEALRLYREVLQLHPRLHGIRAAIHHLRQRGALPDDPRVVA